MLVSWNWLKEYVTLGMSVETLTDRLMMSGLNLEEFGDHKDTGDILIDLEVTSNRPDCLGQIGIARETAVLFQQELRIPAALVKESATKTASVTSVTIENADLCPPLHRASHPRRQNRPQPRLAGPPVADDRREEHQ